MGVVGKVACGKIGVHFVEAVDEGAVVACHGAEGEVGCYKTATHEECHLHHVSPCHGSQAAVDGVDAGDKEEADDDDHAHRHFHAHNWHG